MTPLQRITTEYVESEDRIRISGEGADGHPMILWLTRRLLDRVVPHLVGWLEKQYADLPRADLMLSFAQEAAALQLMPEPPVPIAEGAPQFLVQIVDISPLPEDITIAFRGEPACAASIAFAATPLRQWLGILYQTYLAADWTLAAWPDWVAPDSVASGEGHRVH